MTRTKIIATLGPAVDTYSKIRQLIKAGVDAARLNMSHGVYADHQRQIKYVRQAAREGQSPVPIIIDLQGPRIRVGKLPKEGRELKRGEVVQIHFGEEECHDKSFIPISSELQHRLNKGNRILIHDGLVELKVRAVTANQVTVIVTRGGMIFTHKGVNIPNVPVSGPVITAKDKKDLRFACQQKAEWIALSFVGTADDIHDLRRQLQKIKNGAAINIMAKIERPEAVKNIDAIIAAADGIMVARGDLGVEMTQPKVPVVQKQIIAKCMAAAKPVLVATQMLDSMIVSAIPTRAEVSDVANAVFDHTDAVMLSGETAFGRYPLPAVRMMRQIIHEAEKSPFDDVDRIIFQGKKYDPYKAVAQSAFDLVAETKAKAIIVLSRHGISARMVARHRPETPIVVMVSDEVICRQLNIVWGITAYKVPVKNNLDKLVQQAIELAKKHKLVKRGDRVVIVTGQPVGKAKHANMVEVYEI
ncbi:MAG: pyruvate kinase [Candidatus Komeilibacteria bacterium]|nr:pyruvate kinase [Candidatus Komeilibacteria bacterium]